jgi:hypothetical protein
VAFVRLRLSKNSNLTRRLVKAGKFQVRIEAGALGALLCKGLCIAKLKVRAHGVSPCRIFDRDEPPGLAETH